MENGWLSDKYPMCFPGTHDNLWTESNAYTNLRAKDVIVPIVTLQPNGYTARFTPTASYTGRARFDFTVTDTDGSAWTQTFAALVIDPPSVPPAAPPTIGSFNLSGSNLIVSGSGGPTNGTYYVLTATNVALPVNNWTRIATNPFTVTGTFIFTNDFSPGTPQQFYRLQLP